MYIIDYYKGSNIKSKRREDIISDSLKFFNKNGIKHATMTNLAEYLNIERKTLYLYYASIIDLIVDSYLYRTELYIQHTSFSMDNFINSNKALHVKDKLTNYFLLLKDGMMKINEEYPLFFDFDSFMQYVDKNSETYTRFNTVASNFKAWSDYLQTIIEEGAVEGLVDLNGLDSKSLATVMDQSFRAYLTKTITRCSETGRYKIENIDDFIKIIVKGILIKD